MLSDKCLNDKMNKVVFDPDQHQPPSRLISHSGEKAVWQDLRTGFLRGPLSAYSTSGIRLDEMQEVTMPSPLYMLHAHTCHTCTCYNNNNMHMYM